MVGVPASLEVSWYEVEEEEILSTDWRQRASEHFQKVEAGEHNHDFTAAIGALSLGLSKDRIVRQRSQEINELEALLQYHHFGPND